jgi:hypothetical protein
MEGGRFSVTNGDLVVTGDSQSNELTVTQAMDTDGKPVAGSYIVRPDGRLLACGGENGTHPHGTLEVGRSRQRHSRHYLQPGPSPLSNFVPTCGCPFPSPSGPASRYIRSRLAKNSHFSRRLQIPRDQLHAVERPAGLLGRDALSHYTQPLHSAITLSHYTQPLRRPAMTRLVPRLAFRRTWCVCDAEISSSCSPATGIWQAVRGNRRSRSAGRARCRRWQVTCRLG